MLINVIHIRFQWFRVSIWRVLTKSH